MLYDHEKFMKMALDEAAKGEEEGNSPVGTVIVKDGQVIARGHNKAITNLDLTSHAETDALRNAGPFLGHLDLTGCTLYTTFEPCMMCAGAIVFAGVNTLVLGGNYNPNYGLYGAYSVEKAIELVAQSNNIVVIRGILVEACEAITWRYKAKMMRDSEN